MTTTCPLHFMLPCPRTPPSPMHRLASSSPSLYKRTCSITPHKRSQKKTFSSFDAHHSPCSRYAPRHVARAPYQVCQSHQHAPPSITNPILWGGCNSIGRVQVIHPLYCVPLSPRQAHSSPQGLATPMSDCGILIPKHRLIPSRAIPAGSSVSNGIPSSGSLPAVGTTDT